MSFTITKSSCPVGAYANQDVIFTIDDNLDFVIEASNKLSESLKIPINEKYLNEYTTMHRAAALCGYSLYDFANKVNCRGRPQKSMWVGWILGMFDDTLNPNNNRVSALFNPNALADIYQEIVVTLGMSLPTSHYIGHVSDELETTIVNTYHIPGGSMSPSLLRLCPTSASLRAKTFQISVLAGSSEEMLLTLAAPAGTKLYRVDIHPGSRWHIENYFIYADIARGWHKDESN